jgi:hypothetical protein
MRDSFAHNHLLDWFIEENKEADLVIANGDYSCDTAFVGVSDDAACESARACLEKLRGAFAGRFQATIGDHELGKKPWCANIGGPRIGSLWRAKHELGLQTFWKLSVHDYVLMGITSTLIGLPIFYSELLPEEREQWEQARADHLREIRAAFDQLTRDQRVLLFCHDPSALPFLSREQVVREERIEQTVIGHLHSNLFLRKSRWLAGMPPITMAGHTIKRLSTALREARAWKDFNVVLCPSLAGIELLKDGGCCRAELSLENSKPARFEFLQSCRGKSSFRK